MTTKTQDRAQGARESTGSALQRVEPAAAQLAEHQPHVGSGAGVLPWNPFELMDRLDADAFIKEMEGIASDVLVYVVKDGGKEMTALSKGGIDECCTMLVTQGMCIREEKIDMEMIGSGQDAEAIFKCVAARYAVKNDGTEVRLDQVIGVKREALYEERAALTLQSKVPGKRWRTAGANGGALTYAEALDTSHPCNAPNEKDRDGNGAIGYLHWIVEASTFDDATKAFISAILAGQDVGEFSAGKRFNSFWYEHGAMKAARNARSRLIPAGVKAQVIAMAKTKGKTQEIERPKAAEPQRETKPKRADVPRRDPKSKPIAFPWRPHAGVALDAKYPDGHEHAAHYIVPSGILTRALTTIDAALHGAPIPRGEGQQSPLDEAERTKYESMKAAIVAELDAREVEQDGQQQDAQPGKATPRSTKRSSAKRGDASASSNETRDEKSDTTSATANDGDRMTDDRPLDEDDDDLPF